MSPTQGGGSDQKPRRRERKPRARAVKGVNDRSTPFRRKKAARKDFRGSQTREAFQQHGGFTTVDFSPVSGRKLGVVFGATGPQGGMSTNPVDQVAYMIRRGFKPRIIAPCIVKGPNGEILRTITYGPNGEQTVTVPDQAPTTVVPTPPPGRRAFNVRRRSGTYQPLPDRQGA